MIISRRTAKKLVREGKARIEGKTTDQPSWEQRWTGKVYWIVTRFDEQRTDHFEAMPKEY